MIRPLNHLNTASHLYPKAWKVVETMLQDKGKDLPAWPDWCFLPMSGWYAIVSEGQRITDLNLIGDVGRLAAIGTWRYSQGIYRFDSEILKALAATELQGDVPASVLQHLPEWSIYIETPGFDWLGITMYGFWVHLEWDANTGREELRFLFDTEEALIPLSLHLGDWPLTEAIARMSNEASFQATTIKKGLLRDTKQDKQIAKMVQPLISLVLYLCSEEPEIDAERQPATSPTRPTAKKIKGIWRWLPPDKPRIWTIGKQIRDKLRETHRTSGGTHTVKPHIRRAHWHGFWTGPTKGERKFSYRWLPPILVTGSE